MSTVPVEHVFLLAATLFALGLVGLLVRRNILFMLIAVEIMLNAAGLAFVAAGSRWGQPDGQVMFLFILAMAASEVSVGLALVLQIRHQHKTMDVAELRELRDESQITFYDRHDQQRSHLANIP